MKIKSITEFLHLTNELDNFHITRPHIEMRDGFRFSVQAGEFMHSTVRRHPATLSYEYSHVEVGFPNGKEDLLMKYAQDPETPTQTVYDQVPVFIIDEIINKHGGISNTAEIMQYTVNKIFEYSGLVETISVKVPPENWIPM